MVSCEPERSWGGEGDCSDRDAISKEWEELWREEK